MFSTYLTDWGIDTLQNTKKYYVDTFVKDRALSEPMNSFIEAQTTFAKKALKSVEQLTQGLGEHMSKMPK